METVSPIIEPCRQQLRHSIDFLTETLAAHNTGKRTPKLHPRDVNGDSCFTISGRFHRTGNLGLSGEAAVECLACKFSRGFVDQPHMQRFVAVGLTHHPIFYGLIAALRNGACLVA